MNYGSASSNSGSSTESSGGSTGGRLFGKLKKSIFIPIAGIVLLVVVGYGGLYVYNNYVKTSDTVQTNLTVEETQSVIEKIGELIELPSGEVPILATVTDLSALSDKPFYANAKEGDKVLIYRDSKTAILYRPNKNKIIKVGTVTNTEEQRPEVQESVAGSQSAEFEVIPTNPPSTTSGQ